MCVQSVITEFESIQTEKDSVEKEIDEPTTTVGKFDTPLPGAQQTDETSVRPGRLNNTTSQLDIFDIYRTLNPALAEYIIFSSAQTNFYQNNQYSGPQNKSQ